MNKKIERDSNMELLRIVAMLLVMVVHADFRALSVPDANAISVNPTSASLQFLTESFSIIAVNVFVLLSGWYGIRPKLSRLTEFLFQVLFFGTLCMCCEWLLTGSLPANALLMVSTLWPTSYWFFKAYLALYIISPVLNAFVEHASRKQFKHVLIGFFAFQSFYSWLIDGVSWIQWGYSLPSFAGLYLLARYLHVYKPQLTQFHLWTDICIYLAFVVFNTIAAFFLKQAGRGSWLFAYNSPLVIVGGVYFVLFFSKIKLKSRFVNWVAISAFAVYLTHSNNYLSKYYDGTILKWFNDCSTLTFIAYTATLIIGVYTASILLDKVRLVLWKLICRYIPKYSF